MKLSLVGKIKKLFVVGMLAIVVCGTAMAQIESPVKNASAGLYSTDADNSISLTGWKGVDLDTFMVTGSYGYFGLNASNTATMVLKSHVINMAGMFRVGGVTMGVSYLGSLAGSADAALSISSKENLGDNQYTEKDNNIPMLHNVRVLTGFMAGNMPVGIRAGIDIGGVYAEKTGLSVSNYNQSNSLSFKPQLAGATSFMVGDYTLTPSLDLSVAITNSTGSGQVVYSSQDFTVTAPNGDKIVRKNVMATYVPAATIQVGVGFPQRSENTTWSGNFSYGVGVTVMPEKRVYESTTKDGGTTESDHKYLPDSGHSHSLGMSITATSQLLPRFAIKGKAELGFAYARSIAGGTKETKGTVTPVRTEQTDSVTVGPVISAAVDFAVTDVLHWYAGFSFAPLSYAFNYTQSYAEPGIVVSNNDSKTTTHTVNNPTLSKFGTGLELKPTDDLSITGGLVFLASGGTEITTIGTVLNNANLQLGVVFKK